MTVSTEQEGNEPVRWRAFPSWSQFSWLSLFGGIAALRGGVLLWQGESGGAVWAGGAAILFLCIAALRHWGQYVLTSKRVIVRNGYTGCDIQSVRIDELAGLSIEQGPVARFFNIGTIVLRTRSGDQILFLRGVSDPDVVMAHIYALKI